LLTVIVYWANAAPARTPIVKSCRTLGRMMISS
jgi:hypothetical protein